MRNYYNHTLQTNPRNREEDQPQDAMSTNEVKQPDLSPQSRWL